MRLARILCALLCLCSIAWARGKNPLPRHGKLLLKDAHRKVVGVVMLGNGASQTSVQIVRNVNGVPVSFFADAAGLTGNSGDMVVNESPDCSGAPRVTVNESTSPSSFMVAIPVILGPMAYFGQGAISAVPLVSEEGPLDPANPQDCTDNGGTITSRNTCCDNGFFYDPSNPTLSAAAGVVNMNSFGLTPPFHVDGP